MKYGIQEFKKDFPTDAACLEFIFKTLHNSKCSCGGEYRPITGRKQFQCSMCRFQIAPTAGTIFHKSPTPLSLWFHAIFIFCHAKSGISAKEMQRQLGVTYKCAWRILAQIRKALIQDNTKLKGDVEIDAAYVGGKAYGGKNNKYRVDYMFKKSVITVAIERGGKIRAEVSKDMTADTMTNFIERNVQLKATTLLTDKSPVYKRSSKKYGWESVDHHKKEYVRGDIHINTVETFFAHLKRSIRGTFKSLSKQHLKSYLDAFVFHYNNRHNDKERFEVLLGTLLHA